MDTCGTLHGMLQRLEICIRVRAVRARRALTIAKDLQCVSVCRIPFHLLQLDFDSVHSLFIYMSVCMYVWFVQVYIRASRARRTRGDQIVSKRTPAASGERGCPMSIDIRRYCTFPIFFKCIWAKFKKLCKLVRDHCQGNRRIGAAAHCTYSVVICCGPREVKEYPAALRRGGAGRVRRAISLIPCMVLIVFIFVKS